MQMQFVHVCIFGKADAKAGDDGKAWIALVIDVHACIVCT